MVSCKLSSKGSFVSSDQSFHHFLQYFKKEGNLQNKLMLLKVIKYILEYFKDEYKKALKEDSKRKSSVNGSTYRKTSQGKYDFLKQFSRRNSNKTKKQDSGEFYFVKECSGK